MRQQESENGEMPTRNLALVAAVPWWLGTPRYVEGAMRYQSERQHWLERLPRLNVILGNIDGQTISGILLDRCINLIVVMFVDTPNMWRLRISGLSHHFRILPLLKK